MLNSNQKVIFLTSSFPLTKGSSSGIFIYDLFTAFKKKHANCYVICPAANASTTHNDKVIAVNYFPIKRMQNLAHSPGGIPAIIKSKPAYLLLLPLLFLAMIYHTKVNSRRNDWIIANWSLWGLAALPLTFLGRKVITVLRGSDVHSNARLTMALMKVLLKRCNTIVCVSQEFKELLSSRFPGHTHKIRFIPNGVDQCFLDISDTREQVSRSNEIQILFVGNLIPSKRVDMLISLATQLHDSLGHHLRIHICGDGPMRAELENLCKQKGLSSDITFHGSISRETVSERLAKADIFVFPSEKEGRPNALLEAMASGLPCVAADIAPCRELLGNGAGILFRPGDEQDLLQKITPLIESSSTRYTMGKAARSAILSSGLTWQSTAEKYLSLMDPHGEKH